MPAFSFLVAVAAPVSASTGVVPVPAFSFFVAVIAPVSASTGVVPDAASSLKKTKSYSVEMRAKGFSDSLCTPNTDSGIAMIIG